MTADLSQEIRQLLLGSAGNVAIAILTMGVALGAFVLQSLRRRSKERTLFWFGAFAFLYGLRVLLQTGVMQYLVERSTLGFAIRLITFTIGMPAVMFAWGLVSDRLALAPKVLLIINAVMAIASVAFYSNERIQGALDLLNSVLVIGFTLAYLIYIFLPRCQNISGIKALRVIFLVLGVFVLYTNLVGALSQRRVDVEFIGFFVFICSLGYLTAARSFRNEEQLATLRKELDIARRIQSSILPEQMPRLSGLRLAAKYLPMSEVAGDFYEFLIVDERRIGILIADVSGHGIPAALVASMVKIAIASQFANAHDPAQVISGLNATLHGNLQGQFVTAAYVFFDLELMTGCYSAAGHPPLLRYSPTTKLSESITENGLVLGVFPTAAYSSCSFQVLPGDRFLLYTDGVLEASRNNEEFGEARLLDYFTKASTADQICESVTAAIHNWAGGIAGDDITVVAMQFDSQQS